VTQNERHLIESFRYTVRNELRRVIRQGCLRPLEFWVDGAGSLRPQRDMLLDDDCEVVCAARQAAAERWPELDDVPERSEGDTLTSLEGRYWAVADAVEATAARLDIELVKPDAGHGIPLPKAN
jgi:hypothetical protein